MNDLQEDTIRLFGLGDEQAFRAIYDKYALALRYFACKYLEDDQAVDDVVQDAFVSLWNKRGHFAHEHPMKAYLYNVIRNACLNIIRRRKVESKYLNAHREDDTSTFLDDVLEAEIFQVVSQAFGTLSPAAKRVYELSMEGKNQYEIADILDISVNTVKKHKANARVFMRRQMKEVLSLIAYLTPLA